MFLSSSTARRRNLNSQRGSPSRYRMRGLRASTFTSRVTRLLRGFSSFGSGSMEASMRLHAGVTRVEQHRLHLFRPLALQRDVLAGDHLGAFLQRDLGLLSGVAVLMKADRRAQARFRQRARRHIHVADFHVVAHGFSAQPDGVNRNPLAADLRQRFQIDAAGIVGAVAQQDHRADGQAGGVRRHLLQALADMRRRGAGRSAAPACRSARHDRSCGTAGPGTSPAALSAARR